MSHPYTSHYPIGENINERLCDHEKRIKELESKLGAVSQRESATREDAEPIPARDRNLDLSQAAAPDLLPQYWRNSAGTALAMNYPHFARACDLAAAVTECYDRGSGSIFMPSFSLAELLNSCLAFVRGEPLPQKGG